jgi:hypothetical protein
MREDILARENRRALVPRGRGRKTSRGRSGLLLAPGNDAEEGSVANHLDNAWHCPDGRKIDGYNASGIGGRTQWHQTAFRRAACRG